MKLAVISSLFNPQGFQAPVRNYRVFRDKMMEQGADLFMAEASFDGSFHTDGPIKVHAGPEHIMWQKERLLNLLLDHLPAEYDAVAWVDADVLFQSADWISDTIKRLTVYPVCQLFSHLLLLDSLNRPFERHRWLKAELTPEDLAAKQCHAVYRKPGYAWAARREALVGGFYDLHITGGGDVLMAHAWFGEWRKNYLNPEWYGAYLRWAGPANRKVKGQVGHVPGQISHVWHGSRQNRNYEGRNVLLKSAGFNPDMDVEIDSNGLWRWVRSDQQLRDDVRSYFLSRSEDEFFDSTGGICLE